MTQNDQTPQASSAAPTEEQLHHRAEAALSGSAEGDAYDRPVIVSDEMVDAPVRARHVRGRFDGTSTAFAIWLPDAATWRGRFFQYTYPLQTEDALPSVIEFAASRGGYTVQASGQQGFAHEAAVARFARTVAADHYGVAVDDIFGYLFGGSGGAMQVVGALEKTSGVWQGAVPFVQPLQWSVPQNITAFAFGALVFGEAYERLADAVRPGSTVQPEEVLDELQASVFAELTALGIPPRAWEGGDPTGEPAVLMAVGSGVQSMDPGYVDDFWNTAGYEGAESSPLGELFRSRRVQARVAIRGVEHGADGSVVALVCDAGLAGVDLHGAELAVVTGGDRLRVTGRRGEGTTLLLDGPLAGVDVADGAELEIDNSWYLALHAYFRHALPPDTGEEGGWAAYRRWWGDALPPQRSVDVAAVLAQSTSGGADFSGRITMKAIIVQNLVDAGAFPWHADFYRKRAQRHDVGDETLRVWLNDHAEHLNGPRPAADQTRVIQYDGIYYQALEDVARWVEEGTPPAASTRYEVVEGQVRVPATAHERLGVQPVARLSANGEVRAEVRVGEPVRFVASAATPPGGGAIVRAEWNLAGGEWEEAVVEEPADAIDIERVYAFDEPGTFFPTVRVSAQRSGNRAERHVVLDNLARVRVVVHE